MVIPKWTKLNVSGATNDIELPKPVYGHTSCAYKDNIYTFGGSFMYDKKRMIRESTNQMSIFNTVTRQYERFVPKGSTIAARKNHLAAVYMSSMLVIGGQLQSGKYCNEIYVFDLQYMDWGHLPCKTEIEPFSKGACVSVCVNAHKKG